MKLVTVVGARPQFIKAALVTRALVAQARVHEILVHTGQHHDTAMSQVFFDQLAIPAPAHHLGIAGGSHGAMTGRMLEALESVLLGERPEAVLVYGDTNSTLAGALAAAKLALPVIHVEAGLRSGRRSQPEEINRILTDRVSRLLFCPTPAAVACLAREGITQGVELVGDVMYDMALMAGALPDADATARSLGLSAGDYAVATIHRAENTENATRLAAVLDYVRKASAGLPVVLPVHPRTEKAARELGVSLDGLICLPPLGYFEMAGLVRGARLVLTDSGGLQKEAYFHRVPCVTLRDETEWVETIEAGWNRLWTQPEWLSPRRDIAAYGDGQTAVRIAERVASFLAEEKTSG